MKKLLTLILLFAAFIGHSQIVRDGSAKYIVVNGQIMALVEKDVVEQLPAVYTLAAYNALTQPEKDTLNAVIVSDTAPGLSGAEIIDGDYGDISIASGVWSLDTGVVDSTAIANGSIKPEDLKTEDFGDFSVTAGIASLDAGSVDGGNLDATNSPTAGYIPSYDAGGGFTWVAASGTGSSQYTYNDISTDDIYIRDAQVTDGGGSTDKKIWNRVTSTADSLWIHKDSITLTGSPFIVQNWGADSTVVRKGAGTNFYVADSASILSADAIIVKQRHPISVLKASSTDFFLQGNFSTYVNPSTSYGSDLVTNGTFDTDSNWTKNNGATIDSGDSNTALVVGNGALSITGSNASIWQDLNTNMTTGTWEVKLDMRYSSGSGNVYIGWVLSEEVTTTITGSWVTYTYDITNWDDDRFAIGAASGTTVEVDNVIIREKL